jgi:starch phosphorylase
LAYNFWTGWQPEAQELFQTLNPEVWEKSLHCPLQVLRQTPSETLEKLAGSNAFLEKYQAVLAQFDAYMNDTNTWFQQNANNPAMNPIAYFSAEYGIHESFPMYSGGLGVLSGDHCKSASDLGIPFVAVGLWYQHGFFTQQIDAYGNQRAIFHKYEPKNLAVQEVVDDSGNEVRVTLSIAEREVQAKIWRLQVGRISLLLLDVNIPENHPDDRAINSQLYRADHDTRIRQEMLLGIGGARALKAVGITPSVWHMNEGHSAFMGLERIRDYMANQNLSFEEAVEAVRANAIFTTHTPVPAGHDEFHHGLMDYVFQRYWNHLGLPRDKVLELGKDGFRTGEHFSMTVLAIKLSNLRNGVSQLHGKVSQHLWHDLWPNLPEEKVPIGAVTNGVHTPSWMSGEVQALTSQVFGPKWRTNLTNPTFWEKPVSLPKEAFWQLHTRSKQRLIEEVRRRLKIQFSREALPTEEIDSYLNPHVLTIGFARRFATYKRANLIFRDIERLKAILNHADRPVQIIFAGKAHPADQPGQAVLRDIFVHSREDGFRGKIVLVENYDLALAKLLVAGSDVWLNNPRKPLEASGTSGMKAILNGSINFSVLDGWWVEGYNGKNGWEIGPNEPPSDPNLQDEMDVQSLYETLEKEIVPLYYQQNDKGIPEGWIDKAFESYRSLISFFSTDRMVAEYFEKYYAKAAANQFSKEKKTEPAVY